MTSALKLLESSSVLIPELIMSMIRNKTCNFVGHAATQMKGKLTYQIMIQSHDASASARI